MKKSNAVVTFMVLIIVGITITGGRENNPSYHDAVAKEDIREIWEDVVKKQDINPSSAYILDEHMEGFRILLSGDHHTVADLMLEFVSYRNPQEGHIFNIKYRKNQGATNILKRNSIDPSFQGFYSRENISVDKMVDFVANLNFEAIENLQNHQGDYLEIMTHGSPSFMDHIIKEEALEYYRIHEHHLEKVSLSSVSQSSKKKLLPIYISVVHKDEVNRNMTRYKSYRKAVVLMEVDDILLTEVYPNAKPVSLREQDNQNAPLSSLTPPSIRQKGGDIDEYDHS